MDKDDGAKRLFTVDEANAIVPTLKVRFAKVTQLRVALHETYAELERLGEPPDAKTLERTDGPPPLRHARARFCILMESLTEELSAIEATGVLVKDLDLGLCDFYSEHDGREIWLCWQYGEEQVSFWHSLQSGFADRQPLAKGAPPRLVH